MSKYSQFPRDTVSLLSKRARNMVNSQDYVDWAVGALVDGFDSPSLVVLAGLDDGTLIETTNYFLKAIKELALPIPECELAMPMIFHTYWQPPDFMFREFETSLPNWRGLLRQHVDEIAEQIREGLLDPITGIKRMHAEVVDPLGHPSDLDYWCYLWEHTSSEEGVGSRDEVEEIVGFATAWLEHPEARRKSRFADPIAIHKAEERTLIQDKPIEQMPQQKRKPENPRCYY